MSTLTELTEQLTALKTKLGALEAKIAELAQEPDPEPEWPVPVGETYWAADGGRFDEACRDRGNISWGLPDLPTYEQEEA